MHSTSIFVLVLAVCGAVLAGPSPTTTRAPGDPDCAALEEYCKCEDDDLQCELNVDCEWCRKHDAWDDPSSTTSSTSTKPVVTHTLRVRGAY
ncbi:hypothetical protein GGS26DRAFT_595661 [Hypomontagnella submonticulosa]|nr:hypothetical protein GGS26DRAFT_595661 [Hypomontagnella submonticulosa]